MDMSALEMQRSPAPQVIPGIFFYFALGLILKYRVEKITLKIAVDITSVQLTLVTSESALHCGI